ALASVTGEDRLRSLALAALRPVLTALAESPRRAAGELGIGGLTGLGSVVYALVVCARLLKEPALLAAAESAAGAVDRRQVDSDRELDVVAGSAGALLGLLALQEAIGSEPALERAILCGEHLLARRTATPTGSRAWRSHSEQPLAGFAHGAAGAAYALLLASAAFGRPDFRGAAEEAISYEATLFDPAERNWRDLRPAPSAARRQLSAWCHGASGIGLARLGGLQLLDSPQVRADVTAAVLTTRSVGQGSSDQLCCGAMGRVETLLVAGHRLATPQLNSAAREIASQTLSGANGRGRFVLAGGAVAEGYSPGFFQGLSGIGYQLLRVARPELPSVLLFEVT
nr:type 2 lantipeptide synthetase LanM [Candidatus Dormibacteraeota bacterium]